MGEVVIDKGRTWRTLLPTVSNEYQKKEWGCKRSHKLTVIIVEVAGSAFSPEWRLKEDRRERSILIVVFAVLGSKFTMILLSAFIYNTDVTGWITIAEFFAR